MPDYLLYHRRHWCRRLPRKVKLSSRLYHWKYPRQLSSELFIQSKFDSSIYTIQDKWCVTTSSLIILCMHLSPFCFKNQVTTERRLGVFLSDVIRVISRRNAHMMTGRPWRHSTCILPAESSGESERQEKSCKERQGSCVQILIPLVSVGRKRRSLSQRIFFGLRTTSASTSCADLFLTIEYYD